MGSDLPECRPNGTDFIISKDTRAGSLFRFYPRHAAHDWRAKFIVSDRIPIERFAEVGKGTVGHDRTICILDFVEHLDDMRAAYLINAQFADARFYEPLERAFVFIS